MTLFSKFKTPSPLSTPDAAGDDSPIHVAHAQNVIIPTCDLSSEDQLRSALIDYAQNLIRQENFDDLWHMLRYLAEDGSASEAGHVLLHSGYIGARADFINAAELFTQRSEDFTQFSGFDSLASLYDEHKHHPEAASFALMCLNGMEQTIKHKCAKPNFPLKIIALRTHLEQALSSEHSSLLYLMPQFDDAVSQDMADLAAKYAMAILKTAPFCSDVPRRLGRLLARTPHSTQLDLIARQCSAATFDACGYAQYAWVYLDALVLAPQLLTQLDPHYFQDAIEDVLTHFKSQEVVNRLLAHITLLQHNAETAAVITYEQERMLSAICARLTSEALQELHPLIWADANQLKTSETGSYNLEHLISSGYDRATQHLVSHFHSALIEGKSVVFTGSGIDFIPKPHPS